MKWLNKLLKNDCDHLGHVWDVDVDQMSDYYRDDHSSGVVTIKSYICKRCGKTDTERYNHTVSVY